MRMLAPLISLVTALAFGTAAPANSDSRVEPTETSRIEWKVTDSQKNGGTPSLQIRSDGFSTSLSISGATPDLADVRMAVSRPAGERVTFTISREPGVLICQGTLQARHRGGGSCRFTPHLPFAAALRERGLRLERSADLLAMTLVDVDLAFIDGLKRQGLTLRTAGDAIGAAALGATPAYVAGLRSAGLKLTDISDALACRALDVDEAFVRGIVAAGYRPSAQQIVAMKAMGVTPDYAQKISRAARLEGERK